MRKLNNFSAMLSLFLLVHASIIRAQTVSLTGIVYENSTAKIPFMVPEGKINVYLPDDMRAGDVISGTVSLAPNGKNERTKKANLLELEKYTIFWPDGAPIRATISGLSNSSEPGFIYTFSDKIRDSVNKKSSLLLKNSKGNTISKVEIPLILPDLTRPPDPIPTESISFSYEKMKTEYSVQKKVITSGEKVVSYTIHPRTDINYIPSLNWSINNKEVTPVCASPNQTVIGVPPGTIGKTSIAAKDMNGKTVFEDQFYIVDIKASMNKTNLRRGERTSMEVSVDGLKDCPYPVSMTILNKASEIILLDKGAHQTYQHNPFEKQGDGFISPLNVQQGVTGVVPGAYDISANLILPATAFGDVFHQQKSALKTPEDYNAWVDAVKKDLKTYADKQGADEVGKAANANAQRAIDNIPKCTDKNKLDECNAFADAFLRPVNVPKGAATMWVCGFEAYKAAIKAITGTLGGKPELIDWEVIKNGLEFIRNMGEQLNDEGLQNGASDVKKMVEVIQKAGETKEKLQELNDKLQELNNNVKKEISDNPPQLFAYEMRDLLVESISWSIPGFRTMNGTNAELNINGQSSAGILSLNKSGSGTYEMLIIPGVSKELQEWINAYSNNSISKKDLEFFIPSKPGTELKTLDFKNALIKEIEFPEMDAGGKDIMRLTVKFKPEEIKYTTGAEKGKAAVMKENKQWMPNNFKIELGDLSGKKISKVESFKINMKTTGDNTGDIRISAKEPGRIEIPDLKFYIPESDIQPWKDWFNEFNKTKETKSGSFEIADENGQPLFSFPLNNFIPVSIVLPQPDGEKNYGVIVKPGSIMGSEKSEVQRINKRNSIIGYMDPFQKLLFVAPEHRTDVLNMINATPQANGKYRISSMTVNRKPISYDVILVTMERSQLFDMAEKIVAGQQANDAANESTNPKENVYDIPYTSFTDSVGTHYRFFKDAECEKVADPVTIPCAPNEKFVYDEKTKEGKFEKDGKYVKKEIMQINWCKKGKGFCVEMYQVVGIDYIYDDKDCTRLVDVIKKMNFNCQ